MAQIKRVLIISAKAGAGHIRAAQAIEAAFRERFPEVEVRNIDALAFTNIAFRKTYSAVYEMLVADFPSIWSMLYSATDGKPGKSKTKNLAAFIDRMNARPLLAEVTSSAPDAVVCTHFLPVEVLARARRKHLLVTPLHVVLTDFDVHSMWVHEGVDEYYVATEEMRYALLAGVAGGAGVTATGIPIMPDFSREFPDKPAMRAKLGLRPDAETVLVSAGGFGLASVGEAAAKLADEAPEAQFLTVAGRNEALRKAVERVAQARPGRIVPYGFVTNMHELMAASDLMVSKSGGLTSSESLAMGLPMVVWNPIPGQEERNSDYLLESGAALRANSLASLVFKVKSLLSDSARLARMASAAKSVARPLAAFQIAQKVMQAQCLA